MTSVGGVEPWSAGDQTDPAEPSGSIDPGTGAPTDPGEATHAEVLIGFLTDFHAAARAPAEPEPAPTQAKATDRALPSRFAAFVPPDPHEFDDADVLAPISHLPVWPPPPGPDPAVPAAVPASPSASPPATDNRERQPRLRRFGRKG